MKKYMEYSAEIYGVYLRFVAREDILVYSIDECFVYLSSCIGKSDLPSATIKTIKDGKATYENIKINKKPFELIEELDLNKPIFAKLCRNGLV